VIWLATLAVVQSPETSSACAVASQAIRVIRKTIDQRDADVYVDRGPTPSGEPSILTACPRILHHLPHGWRVAGDDVRDRLRHDMDPRRPYRAKREQIWSVGVPLLWQKETSATVSVDMICGSLCGTNGTWRFERTRHRWRYRGPLAPMAIS
jgi:hypothetical protein